MQDLEDTPNAVEWLLRWKQLKPSQECRRCGDPMNFRTNIRVGVCIDGCRWVCGKRLFRNASLSVRNGSVFAGSKHSLQKIMMLMYFWSMEIGVDRAAIEADVNRDVVLP